MPRISRRRITSRLNSRRVTRGRRRASRPKRGKSRKVYRSTQKSGTYRRKYKAPRRSAMMSIYKRLQKIKGL